MPNADASGSTHEPPGGLVLVFFQFNIIPQSVLLPQSVISLINLNYAQMLNMSLINIFSF